MRPEGRGRGPSRGRKQSGKVHQGRSRGSQRHVSTTPSSQALGATVLSFSLSKAGGIPSLKTGLLLLPPNHAAPAMEEVRCKAGPSQQGSTTHCFFSAVSSLSFLHCQPRCPADPASCCCGHGWEVMLRLLHYGCRAIQWEEVKLAGGCDNVKTRQTTQHQGRMETLAQLTQEPQS